jgi:hypothetical protein
MFEQLKKRWHHFSEAPPGQRFKEHFHQRQQQRPSALHNKILAFGGGILLIGLGLIMLIAPGPGILVVGIGAALIAQESLTAARMLDWLDIRIQPLIAWLAQLWRGYQNR